MHNRFFLSILSSFLLFLALENILGGVTAWIALIPLFYLLDQLETPRQTGYGCFLTGFIHYLSVASWLTQVTVGGYIAVSLILASNWALFGWLYKRWEMGKKTWGILAIACSWAFLEYLRSVGDLGFPWFFLGYSQVSHLAFIQSVSWGGIFVLSFLIVWVNGVLYEILFLKKKSLLRKWVLTGISLFFLSLNFLYGYFRLKHFSLGEILDPIKIAVIQGNIPQGDKWDLDQEEWIVRRYARLTFQAAKDHPDLMVWPETALPANLKTDEHLQDEVMGLARKTGSFLLIGGSDDRYDTERVVTNAAFLIGPDGRLNDQYDKIHLVPGGEYVPFRTWFPWIANMTLGEIDFSRGNAYKVFKMGEWTFSAVICFEDIFPDQVRRFVRKGAHLMVNLTNDAWFGISSAAQEHLNLARFSAIANGVGMVRATNTGISAFISPVGEILETVRDSIGNELEVEGVAVREISLQTLPTFYQKYGDVFSWVCGCVVLIFGGFVFTKKRRSSHDQRNQRKN